MKITVQFEDQESWGLAEVLKRIGYEDIRSFSKDDVEAREAETAIDKIKIELARNGVDPR